MKSEGLCLFGDEIGVVELGDADEESWWLNAALRDESRQAPAEVPELVYHRDHHERMIDAIGEGVHHLSDRSGSCLRTGTTRGVSLLHRTTASDLNAVPDRA